MKLESTSKIIKLHYIKIFIYLWIYDMWIVDCKRSILEINTKVGIQKYHSIYLLSYKHLKFA